QREYALELGKGADALARLPAPVVPFERLHLGIEPLAEGARLRPHREPLHAHHDFVEPRRACRQFGGNQRIWFVEKFCCRRPATGLLFPIGSKYAHGIVRSLRAPAGLALTTTADSRSAKARVISRTIALISRANDSRPKFFWTRHRGSPRCC